MDIGSCAADIASYHYNADTGRCDVFTYTGCQGNANRFSDKSECMSTCAVSRSPLDKTDGKLTARDVIMSLSYYVVGSSKPFGLLTFWLNP